MKTHVIHEYKPWYRPAYLSNGLIGVRLGQNALTDRQALLAGFTGVSEIHRVEAVAPLPAPRFNLYIGRDNLRDMPDHYQFISQAYDFSCGELTTVFRFTDHEGRSVKCEHTAFCARSMPTILAERLTITAEAGIDLGVSVELDARDLPIREVMSLKPNRDADIVMQVSGEGDLTTAGIALKVFSEDGKLQSADDARSLFELWGYERGDRLQAVQGALEAGESATLQVMTSYVPSTMHTEPHWQAVRMIKMATWHTYDAVRRANRACWDEIWKGRITVKGASEAWQDCVDASYYYLYATMHTSSPYGIAPFGLSDRFIYKGHVFWDSDSFMFLMPLLSDPNIARTLLDYRFDRLEAARNNARLNGYRGVQYPWQSLSSGCEVTRVSAGQAGGAGEQHINMDVAMGFVAFAYVSGDEIFLREKAWPVVRGVAEWIDSRVTKTARGYEILHVCGIDEARDNVDNDAFTNVMSARVLREANHIAEKLGYPRNALWDGIADGLVLPV